MMSQRKRKHDRREITISSDESSMKMVYPKEDKSHSGTSGHKKKHSKHKKNKKLNKYHSDVSSNSENESDYESKKENKKAMKYKKKHSKEKFDNYDERLSKNYERNKYYDEKQDNSRSDKMYKDDISPEKNMSDSKKSRKRSRSKEKQRYGKWSETTDKNKKMYSSNRSDFDDRESVYEIQNKRQGTSDKYNRKGKHQDDSDMENHDGYENYTIQNKRQRSSVKYSRKDKNSDDSDVENHDDYENYKVQNKKHKTSDKYSRKEKHSDDSGAENHNDYETRHKRPRTSDKYSRKEKQHDDSNIEKHDDYENYDERRKSRRKEMSYERERNDSQKRKYEESKYYNQENHDNSSRVDSFQERRSYFSNKVKRPREYIDLDDPNNQNVENETVLQDKQKDKKPNSKKTDDIEPLSKKEKIVNINTRTGGAYIPPARLRMMQESIQDKSSEAYQRLAWEALKKTIIGMTNKVNSSNISDIVVELFKENIIRGRGVLARAIMQAQGASPTFTRVYAALVAVINSKFPEIGELILKRLIIQYKRGFRRNDKTVCLTAARFLAHLLNQEVAHEILILEIVTHLLENPTDDSVEVAICILKECGKKLTQLTARGMRAITERVREVLHEGNVNSRTRYMIEVFFAVQKDGFKEFEIITEELDLIEDEDKFTHLITLDEGGEAQEMLNIFKFDPEYQENEEKYKAVVKEILGDSDEEESGAESDSEGEEEEDEEKKEESQQIVDMTETNIVCLRRKIYLTIQSSLDFEECAHKLLKLELKPGQILEMCYMILDCCAQQRTYEKFYGLLAQRFCRLNKIYVEPFTEIFQNSYKTIHRLETNKLRNVAKFFAHLLFTDAISWTVLSIIKLNEDDTSSSSRIFIKILFQELCEYLGLAKLNERVKDVTLQEAFEGLFPRDLPHNTRFAINFFTSIGLGGLTDELREHLKNMQKTPVIQASPIKASSSSVSSSSSSSSTSSSSSSSDSD